MRQIRATEGRSDVITFLRAQHTLIRELLGAVLAVRGEARVHVFARLERTLAVHETAEAEILHPFARRALTRGDRIVSARLAEENALNTALVALERLSPESTEFEMHFRALEATVVAHVDAEEREEFARLVGKFALTHSERMMTLAELADATASWRPHPGSSSSPTDVFFGPFSSMLDRTRAALAASGHQSSTSPIATSNARAWEAAESKFH